ncbi:Tetratricopeptide TPR_2 repeat protein [Beijerinckia indica subsp. indica ATCC 9039]|uniref:Tetratricopeptide TPR_2 repeat protein n=2 Tax=Beijerinckia TaxID=532 RepID=B2IG93_BEII9|nr:Tetratricopeptide TPR_2 repeat protein [Beijerinckia indica subsp. indica ATCC 9039]
MDLKRFAEAADDFTAVIRLNPKIAGYYDNRQYAYKALRLLKEAMKDATEAVRLAPTYSFVYRSRGLLLTDLEQYDLAEADFTTAISLAPKDGGLFVDRGKMFVAAKKTHEAVADFTHAIDMDANNAIALRERGLAYKMLGDYAAATADLSLFARLEPGDQEVNRAQHEIQNLQKLPNAVTSPPARLPEAKNSDADKNGSSGTGFFVSPRGYIVTNAHVVNGCKDVQITSGLSPKISARILTQDSANDLALLKSDLRPNTLVPLRVGVRIGENVAVFGFPLIGLLATSGNFSVGIVSALAGLGDDTRYLQISAPVQPGNSGGPVLDQSGNIVGVVVAKLDAINVAAITKDVPQNVNFAIKTSVLTNLLDANGVDYSTGSAGQFLQSADLAERAKSIAVLIECGP